MKFNFKSKLGFTLIELLVVIGILAVLAAIAIPSVAGLIDRANVSADATNANEMTNAIERFVSEYELYCQDIASSRLKAGDYDSAQGRVYNVTGVTDRAGIEALEKDATAGVDTTGKAIYRDTKYPVNAETMQAVVENYMKTSSTTFTPKQSDCHYYYSPDCGLVVCTETNKSAVTDLNKLVQSGKDAKGKELGVTTKWIDLTTDISVSGGNDITSESHNGVIPEGGTYYSYTTGETLTAGDEFPEEMYPCDEYIYGDFHYYYQWCPVCDGYGYCGCSYTDNIGWCAETINSNQQEYGNVLDSINNTPITIFKIYATGQDVPYIPSTVNIFQINNYYYGYNCYYTQGMEVVGDNTINGWSVRYVGGSVPQDDIFDTIKGQPIVDADYCFQFSNFEKLENVTFPDTIKTADYLFANSKIQDISNLVLPSKITTMDGMFYNTNLTNINGFVIPSNVTSLEGTFAYTNLTSIPDLTHCTNLTTIGEAAFYECYINGTIKLPATLTSLSDSAFQSTVRFEEDETLTLEVPCSIDAGYLSSNVYCVQYHSSGCGH